MVSRPLAIICLRPFSSCHRQMLTIAAISVACSVSGPLCRLSLVSPEIVVTEVADDPFEVDSTVLFFAEQCKTHTLSFNCLASFRDLFSFWSSLKLGRWGSCNIKMCFLNYLGVNCRHDSPLPSQRHSPHSAHQQIRRSYRSLPSALQLHSSFAGYPRRVAGSPRAKLWVLSLSHVSW